MLPHAGVSIHFHLFTSRLVRENSSFESTSTTQYQFALTSANPVARGPGGVAPVSPSRVLSRQSSPIRGAGGGLPSARHICCCRRWGRLARDWNRWQCGDSALIPIKGATYRARVNAGPRIPRGSLTKKRYVSYIKLTGTYCQLSCSVFECECVLYRCIGFVLVIIVGGPVRSDGRYQLFIGSKVRKTKYIKGVCKLIPWSEIKFRQIRNKLWWQSSR